MTTYFDTPLATQQQSASQPQIRTNFSTANTVFNKDHYAFSDLTGNAGHHQVIQSPVQSAHAIPTTNPELYGMQDSSNIGVLQYSRAPSQTTGNALPTPLSSFSSPIVGQTLANGSSVNILDFSGLTLCIANVYAFSTVTIYPLSTTVFWKGSSFAYFPYSTSNSVALTDSGSTLSIKNISGNDFTASLYWTIEFVRIQTSSLV